MKNSELFYYIGRTFYKLFYKIVFGLTIEGQQHIPRKGSAIIAPNHASYIDPPLVAVALPRPLYFMAKAELFKNPFFGFILRKVNVFPVKRSSKDVGVFKEAFSGAMAALN